MPVPPIDRGEAPSRFRVFLTVGQSITIGIRSERVGGACRIGIRSEAGGAAERVRTGTRAAELRSVLQSVTVGVAEEWIGSEGSFFVVGQAVVVVIVVDVIRSAVAIGVAENVVGWVVDRVGILADFDSIPNGAIVGVGIKRGSSR